jgi:acyl-CoA synthetase (AMP-forming)/AMP-acid ligase II
VHPGERETALAFRDGLFRTGDVGYQDSAGYFYILDHLRKRLNAAMSWQNFELKLIFNAMPSAI